MRPTRAMTDTALRMADLIPEALHVSIHVDPRREWPIRVTVHSSGVRGRLSPTEVEAVSALVGLWGTPDVHGSQAMPFLMWRPEPEVEVVCSDAEQIVGMGPRLVLPDREPTR